MPRYSQHAACKRERMPREQSKVYRATKHLRFNFLQWNLTCVIMGAFLRHFHKKNIYNHFGWEREGGIKTIVSGSRTTVIVTAAIQLQDLWFKQCLPNDRSWDNNIMAHWESGTYLLNWIDTERVDIFLFHAFKSKHLSKSLKEATVLRTDRRRQTVTAVNLSSSKPGSKAETLSPIWTCGRAKQELNTNASVDVFFFYLLNFKCLPGQWHFPVHHWGKHLKEKKKKSERRNKGHQQSSITLLHSLVTGSPSATVAQPGWMDRRK